jgi:hypothetical protein
MKLRLDDVQRVDGFVRVAQQMFVAYYFVGRKPHLHDSCRDAGHNGIARNVIDNDCAGCDHGTSTDGQTGDDDGPVPDPNVIFDDRLVVIPRPESQIVFPTISTR